MFHITHDPRTNVLRITVKGFWNPADVPKLAKGIDASLREVGDDFDAIVESFDFPVQANDVADLLTAVMRGGMARTSGRAAVVVGSLLNRAQAERTLVHPRVRVFMTMEEAEAWLASGVRDADIAPISSSRT
ncbi:hypothetical protein [Sphingobium phenoxybenzoativorans]|uniref:hypothetical protein n=1 Tax=Sphingobium phenoxybenzoativorans TaxID=1592790 RepID=UPI0008728C6C|nr:hypothetical protein [Sphingobium phenoxybenzoativorans]